MALSKDTQLQMISFIRAHHDHLTLTDMAEELAYLGITYNQIHAMCSRLNIAPISGKKQVQNFILEYHRTRTVPQLARALNLSDHDIIRLCKELGISPSPPKPKSPGKILGEFTMAGANHYSAHSTYPALFTVK